MTKNRQIYFQSQLKITNKQGKTVPFLLNPIQLKIDEVVKKLEKKNKPIRILILKARREGVTTYVGGYIFNDTACNPNVSSLITAHIPKSTNDIFDIYKLFYDELHPAIKPMRRYNNRTELVFDNPSGKDRENNPGLRSKIVVATSNTIELARGSRLNHYHGSEVAYYKNAKKLMIGVFNAVPYEPNTSIWLETTANGVGGWYHKFFYKAYRKENEYIALFFAWWQFPEYRKQINVVKKKHIISSLDDEEKVLVKKFKCSIQQLAWRRWAIENLCQGEIELFHQEFPSTIEEAFITSGRPVFNRNNLQLFKVRKGQRGYIENKKFFKDEKGDLVIYQMPIKGRNYVIGGDVAEGKLIESSDEENEFDNFTRLKGDWSVLVVMDAVTRNVVAKYRGHPDPDILGDIAINLGYFYNTALLAIEANPGGYGIVTNKRIYKKKYPKNKIYFSVIVDRAKNKKTRKIGWWTTTKSRPLLIAIGKTYIREMTGEINDLEIISECMTFIVKESGKEEAEIGCYDDCCLAFCIACYVIEKSASSLVMIKKDNKIKKGNTWDHLVPQIPFIEE